MRGFGRVAALFTALTLPFIPDLKVLAAELADEMTIGEARRRGKVQ